MSPVLAPVDVPATMSGTGSALRLSCEHSRRPIDSAFNLELLHESPAVIHGNVVEKLLA